MLRTTSYIHHDALITMSFCRGNQAFLRGLYTATFCTYTNFSPLHTLLSKVPPTKKVPLGVSTDVSIFMVESVARGTPHKPSPI